jgi:hypothetical protein
MLASHSAPTVRIQAADLTSHSARNALIRNGVHADSFAGPDEKATGWPWQSALDARRPDRTTADGGRRPAP